MIELRKKGKGRLFINHRVHLQLLLHLQHLLHLQIQLLLQLQHLKLHPHLQIQLHLLLLLHLQTQLHCVSKNIPDIFDCNLKTNYQILIISDMNISDTTCHQMIIQFSTSPSICFCTTWEKHLAKYRFLSNAI